jgi:signal transduction histidine kinase
MKSMPLDKRRYLLYTHCFIPDAEGFCWISTNRGLLKAKLDEMINAFENNQPAIYYHYFGKNDGMEMMEMNGGCNPCALQLKNKTLSFPTMDGLLWVNPDKAKPILPEGEIYIDEISADSITINPELEKIILPAKTNELLIKLSFAAWCNKENIYLDYQLNDTLTWKTVNTQLDDVIRLTNLTPGDYTLRIRKMNGYGINNYSYKKIEFSITIPWYKKWWFNLLVLVFIGGLISLYVQYRTNQLKRNQSRLEKLVSEKTKELQEKNEVLEKNDSIKTRLISIISHDIVTPLKFLTSAGKNLIEKKKQMPELLQEETLKEMTNTSQELQMLSTNILNWIKFQNENRRLAREQYYLHELTEQVIGILKSLAKSKNLQLKNDLPKDIIIYQYYEPVKILVYNLLTNAINFSEQGTIRISGKKEKGNVLIEVEDQGVGMTPEQVQHLLGDQIVITATNIDNKKGHGLGFLIIKDLLKMTGGSMTIKSERGTGSKISIILPANNYNQSENN